MPPFKANTGLKRSDSTRTVNSTKEPRNRHELSRQAMLSAKDVVYCEPEPMDDSSSPRKEGSDLPPASQGAAHTGASNAPSSAQPLIPGKAGAKPPLAPIDTEVSKAKSNTTSTSPERKASEDKASMKAPQQSPATAAYRDLLTGDVVEIDQEGNAAVPTQHPTIKNPVAVHGQKTVCEDDFDGLPSGLKAAANFLSDRGRTGAEDEDRDGDDEEEDATWSNDLSAHVSGFAVASSKRNADFHSLFPDIPEDDYLIKSYGCALSRDLLIHGRMYISEAHLGFYSNIFGWVTEVLVPFSDIVSIEKRNTAYVIPNAISIATLQHKVRVH